jgi:Secretion system C-terminal sorting domain
MKKIILLSFLFLGINKIHSQVSVPLQNCYIKYEYDNTGNRVKRSYYCEVPASALSTGGKILNTNPTAVLETITDENIGVKLFPNPVDNDLKIEVPETTIGGSITINDMKGIVLKSIKIEQKNNSINLSDLSRGSYTVVIDSEKLKVSKVILKQ